MFEVYFTIKHIHVSGHAVAVTLWIKTTCHWPRQHTATPYHTCVCRDNVRWLYTHHKAHYNNSVPLPLNARCQHSQHKLTTEGGVIQEDNVRWQQVGTAICVIVWWSHQNTAAAYPVCLSVNAPSANVKVLLLLPISFICHDFKMLNMGTAWNEVHCVVYAPLQSKWNTCL